MTGGNHARIYDRNASAYDVVNAAEGKPCVPTTAITILQAAMPRYEMGRQFVVAPRGRRLLTSRRF